MTVQKKVLLVDDDADDRLLFCEAMAEVDREVICLTAADGKAAMVLLKEKRDEFPDLIFLDINMSGKSGWHYLNLLKEDSELQHIPVIMYSTSSTNPDIEKAVNLGALILFTKPDSFEDLKVSLETILRHLNQGSVKTICDLQLRWFHPGAAKQEL